MLGKLLKYEIKATARIFLLLYGALLVVAGIFRLFLVSSINADWMMNMGQWTTIITGILYVFMIVAVFTMTFFVMLQRFYKNLLGDEGYLMFTLPVPAWQHIVSKLLTSMLWVVMSTIVTFISIMILVVFTVPMNEVYRAIQMLFAKFMEVTGLRGGVLILQMALLMVLSMSAGTLMVYLAMAIGQLSTKHKVLASFGAFLGIMMISQMLWSVFTAIIIIPGGEMMSQVQSMEDFQRINVPQAASFLLLGSAVVYLVENAAYFFFTNLILKRQLNLE